MYVMRNADPYPHEQKRLESLRRIRLLDTPVEERFERLTRMVCRLLDVPISLFNLIDDKQQFYKSVQGLNNTYAALDGAFCPHAFHETDMLLVPNAKLDDRFSDNPFVTGKYLNVGFYAGCAVRTPDGMPVGTICAIDMKPRDLTEEQLTALRDIAAMVETELRIAYMQFEKEELETELEQANRLAMIDPMTRLWNRAGMEVMLNKEWSEMRRLKNPITLAMCDIDHFKQLNDTYGHDVGDQVICYTARKLMENLRAEDHVCRIGGEEFLLILPNCTSENAQEILEHIRAAMAVAKPVTADENRRVTMSFGIATLVPNLDTPPGLLIKAADVALYEAKNGGRNRVVLSSEWK